MNTPNKLDIDLEHDGMDETFIQNQGVFNSEKKLNLSIGNKINFSLSEQKSKENILINEFKSLPKGFENKFFPPPSNVTSPDKRNSMNQDLDNIFADEELDELEMEDEEIFEKRFPQKIIDQIGRIKK